MLLLLLRTLLLYAVLLVGERLMGKRQIGQLQTSELVSTLLLSELAVLPIQNGGDPLWRGLLPMGALILCEVGVSLWMLKSGRFRQLVCGRPMVVVAHGKILQGQMRRLRMTTEDLLEQLRQSGSFYLEEVDWAIVETNGTLSVLRRPDRDPLTPEQAGVAVRPQGLEAALVSDGEVNAHSLALLGLDRAWLEAKLRKAGVDQSQVFLFTARSDGSCRLVKKEKNG